MCSTWELAHLLDPVLALHSGLLVRGLLELLGTEGSKLRLDSNARGTFARVSVPRRRERPSSACSSRSFCSTSPSTQTPAVTRARAELSGPPAAKRAFGLGLQEDIRSPSDPGHPMGESCPQAWGGVAWNPAVSGRLPEVFNIDIDSEEVGVQCCLGSLDTRARGARDAACQAFVGAPRAHACVSTEPVAVAHAGTCTDQARADALALSSLQGQWWHPAELGAGMVIEVQRHILSGNRCPCQILAGTRGTVTQVDGDGDAIVYFPAIVDGGGSVSTYIFKHDFNKVKKFCTGEQA